MRHTAILGLTVIGVPLYVAFGCFIGKVLAGASEIQRKEGYSDEFSPVETQSEKQKDLVAFPHHQLA